MKIAAVVVTFNRKELLKECLTSLLKQTRPLDEIYVIDNASNDGTWEMMEKEDKRLIYIRLPENIGGAGGFHEGIKAAYEKGNDWIWLFDDDAIAKENSLAEIISSIPDFKEIKVGAILSNIISSESASVIDNKWEEVKEGDYLVFVGVLLSKQMIASIGLPKKEYFIYCDDLEYFNRMKENRFKLLKVFNSQVYHKDWGAQPQIAKSFLWFNFKLPAYSAWKDYYLYRNQIIMSKTKLNSLNFKELFKYILKSILAGSFDRAYYLIRGTIDGFLGRTGKIVYPS